MRSRVFVIIGLTLSTILFACSGEKSPHERLSGAWDIDDKASWEYQHPGKQYEPSSAELERDISLQFDIKEQTCQALNAFGSHLLRYRVVSEDKDKVTLNIGENTFIFELKGNDRVLLCPSDGNITSCLVFTKGKVSTEAESARMAKAESRLIEIVKRLTQSVASRTEQFLIRALLDPGAGVTDADVFRLHVAEVDTFERGQLKDTEQLPEEVAELMNTMLRDVVLNNNLQYARIYTSKGTIFLHSDINPSQLSAMQHKFILNVVKTGNPGPIAFISSGDELLFELYLPLLKPFANDEKDVVGVLAIARPMNLLPDECFKSDIQVSGGSLYFVRYTGQNYQIIGTKGVKAEAQALELNDAGEMPFARRKSLVGDEEVCSQASHGPATNSWILLEMSCLSVPE